MAFVRNNETVAPVTSHTVGGAQTIQRAPAGAKTGAMTASKQTDIFSFVSGGENISFSTEDIKNYFCANATIEECVLFGHLCKKNGLDPWAKDAYLIKYDQKSPAAMVTGKNAYMKRAESHPQFDGYEAGVKVYLPDVGQVEYREGTAFYKDLGEQLIGGWAKVYRKDRGRPYYEEVPLKEYDKGQSKWKEAPATMIRKVALVHALREAFPTNIQGMYDADETPYAADYEGSFREMDDPTPAPSMRGRIAPEPVADPLEDLEADAIEEGEAE